jgi:hypothetical protein
MLFSQFRRGLIELSHEREKDALRIATSPSPRLSSGGCRLSIRREIQRLPKHAAISRGFLAAQRGFELLNPETRPAPGKGLTANSGAIGA